MKPTRGPVDIRIEYQGSLYLLRPLSRRAVEWLDANTASEAQYFADAVVVEPRYVGDLLEGLRADGLVVQ